MALRSKLLIAVGMMVLLAVVMMMGIHYKPTEDGGGTPKADLNALAGLRIQPVRCELGAKRYEALVKVFVKVSNAGTEPIRLGPGSFWLRDATGASYLDRYAAEQPNAEPITLKPNEPEQEISMRFNLPAVALGGPLVLLVGPAAKGNPAGTPPPAQPLVVLIKENGAPKGPFVEGQWRTFTDTKWK